MTIWDFLFPWRNVPALKKARRENNVLRGKANQQFNWRKIAVAEIEALEREKQGLKTELLQTRRAGLAEVAEDLGVSFEDIKDGNIEVLLHDDPQAVYRALDNAKASEIKFRLVKTVNRELRLVLRNIIDGLYLTDLTEEGRMYLELAEPYAVPRVMEPKRKVLRLNQPKGDDDGTARTQTEESTEGAAK